MDLSRYLSQVQAFLNKENGLRLADLLYIRGGHAHHLLDTALEYRPDDLERECRDKIDQQLWDDITLLHIRVLISRGLNDYPSAYTEQAALVQSFLRTFPTLTRWSLPILYTIHNDLWLLANEADEQLKIKGEKGGKLEDAARNINKAFTACITDRGPLSTSRKWGTYYIINLLFKTYFRLKQQNLCKNVLRAVRASDLPGVEQFPKSHRVTYRYYLGVLNFLEEDYKKAEAELMVAFKECHSRAKKNKEQILHFLLPTLLVRGVLPSRALLDRFPRLGTLYDPLVLAARAGNVKEFDRGLARAERPLVARGTYLTVERARVVVVRVLFRKVFNLMDRTTKLPVSVFQQALAFVGMNIDLAEVECMLANMIYKGYIKGYLSHEKLFLVLSSKDPFPSFKEVNGLG
ncbi:hypothetical protein BC936DRAFT_149653 [Jimgerdemannia flammicorona]|uniref:Protein CSN12 homolog n=1 Tax=Jimgerdemannia flammicorona TaxID=994334 RepID=A0A433D0F4_9FUNG|nr:hypothetical protein BC936DRAFT_149653 [Jimgerdemannia flammicorona]